MSFLVCGEALIDLIKQQDSSWIAHNGGGPMNTAKALAQLELPTQFLGRISKDNFGQNLLTELVSYDVGVKHVVAAPEPTSLAVVEVDSSGAASYSFYLNETSNFNWQLNELPTDVSMYQAIHIGTLALVIPPGDAVLFDWLKNLKNAPMVMIDLNVRPSVISDKTHYSEKLAPLMAQANILKVSEDDLEFLYPNQGWHEVAQQLLATFKLSLIAVTLGSGGAALITPEIIVFENAPAVQVVDTVGAGDTFSAGLLFKLHEYGALDNQTLEMLSNEDLQYSLHFAVNAAALSCTKAGAVPPTRAEVEAFINVS